MSTPLVEQKHVFLGPDPQAIVGLVSEASAASTPQVSEPTESPCSVYPTVPGIDCSLFQLPPTGLSPDQRAAALEQLKAYETTQKSNFLGYQANQALEYDGALHQYLDFHVNNIGDPFTSGNFTVNSKFMERAVLDYYAALWNAKWPHDSDDPESYWGYVLTMGSTEGNLYGLWNGRDYLAGKALLNDQDGEEEARVASLDGRPRAVPRRLVYAQAPAPEMNLNAYTPVCFYSQDTHYSIIKAMRVLAIKTFYEIGTERYPGRCPITPTGQWPQEVPSKDGNAGPGSIDVDALAKLVEFFAAEGFPILVCFNYGTTFKGAYDDVEAAGNALMPIFERYGLVRRKVHYDPTDPEAYDWRTGYWFHVDGALGAAFMPFVEMAYDAGLIDQRGPNFDFRLPFVHSISMSGHKWIGAPWPTGIYMTKVKMQLRPPDDPEYIGSPDTTFAGSRSGFSAMIFWDYLSRWSYDRQIGKALRTEALGDYTYQQLKALEQELGQDLWVERTPLSLTIRFKAVNAELVFKYSLSGETLYVDGEQRAYNHVFMMEHVTRERIDAFIADCRQPGAFPDQDTEQAAAADVAAKAAAPAPARASADGARRLLHVPHAGRGFTG